MQHHQTNSWPITLKNLSVCILLSFVVPKLCASILTIEDHLSFRAALRFPSKYKPMLLINKMLDLVELKYKELLDGHFKDATDKILRY